MRGAQHRMRGLMGAIAVLMMGTIGAARAGEIDYDDIRLARVVGRPGFVTQLSFPESESIREVAVGDAEHWTVQVGIGGHQLLLKPRAGAHLTNLIVATQSRSFAFELSVERAEIVSVDDILFTVHPRLVSRRPTPDERFDTDASNRNYLMEAGRRSGPITPDRMFDDGHLTYIRFPGRAEIPAPYAVAEDGEERMVNFHSEGNYMILHEVGPHYVLRLGGMVVGLWQGRPPPAAPAAPVIAEPGLEAVP